MVSQTYHVHVHDEYVLLGNAGLLRCLIPSFVSDFVIVDSWVGEDGTHITADTYGIGRLFMGTPNCSRLPENPAEATEFIVLATNQPIS